MKKGRAKTCQIWFPPEYSEALPCFHNINNAYKRNKTNIIFYSDFVEYCTGWHFSYLKDRFFIFFILFLLIGISCGNPLSLI